MTDRIVGYIFCLVLLIPGKINAQITKIGIGTNKPTSTLTVAGSFSGNYRIVTDAYSDIRDDDYFVSYQSTGWDFRGYVLSLPRLSEKTYGRSYFIKNETSFILTIRASGWDQFEGAIWIKSSDIKLQPGGGIEIKHGINCWQVIGDYSPPKTSPDAGIVYIGGSIGVMADKIDVPVGIVRPELRTAAVPPYGGILLTQGSGFKVSNPENGTFVITFDRPFTSKPACCVNIYDTYKGDVGKMTDPTPDVSIAGKALLTKDNSQITYITPSEVRVKTGNGPGNPSNRSFTFIVMGVPVK